MVRSLIPLLMYTKLTFVIINDNNGETLPNLIKLKTPIEKGKGRNNKKGPTSNQKTTPKNTNAQIGPIKKGNVDSPKVGNLI